MKEYEGLAELMKEYEQEFAGKTVDINLPICIRLDGKNFSTFTKSLNKPFDDRLGLIMEKTLNYLLLLTGASIGYTQSDEISLIILPEHNKNIMFKGKIQKISSVLSAKASVKFNKLLSKYIPEKFIDDGDDYEDNEVVLDTRVWNVPNVDLAFKNILNRMIDARKNSISMCVYAYGENKQFIGKGTFDRLDYLKSIDKDWNNINEKYKTGIFALKKIDEVVVEGEKKELAIKFNQPLNRFQTSVENFTLPQLLNDFENQKCYLLNKISEVQTVKSLVNERKKNKTKRN